MIAISSHDAFKMRLYGYEVQYNSVSEQYLATQDDWASYIEDVTGDYLSSQGLI